MARLGLPGHGRCTRLLPDVPVR